MYWQWLRYEEDITTSINAHRDATVALLWSTDHVLLATFTHSTVSSKSGKPRWEFYNDDDAPMGKGEAMQHLRRELNT